MFLNRRDRFRGCVPTLIHIRKLYHPHHIHIAFNCNNARCLQAWYYWIDFSFIFFFKLLFTFGDHFIYKHNMNLIFKIYSKKTTHPYPLYNCITNEDTIFILNIINWISAIWLLPFFFFFVNIFHYAYIGSIVWMLFRSSFDNIIINRNLLFFPSLLWNWFSVYLFLFIFIISKQWIANEERRTNSKKKNWKRFAILCMFSVHSQNLQWSTSILLWFENIILFIR